MLTAALGSSGARQCWSEDWSTKRALPAPECAHLKIGSLAQGASASGISP